LFNNDWICDICCFYDILDIDPKTGELAILKVIEEKTGKRLTKEELFETCEKCNKQLIKYISET